MKSKIYPTWLYGLLILGLSLILSSCAEDAEAQPVSSDSFAEASIQGTYAGYFIGEGGRLPMAGVMVINFDGNGGISGGRAVFSYPDLSNIGQRLNIESQISTADYDIDENGKGHIHMPKLFDDWIEAWSFTAVVSDLRPGQAPLAQQLYMAGDTTETQEGNLVIGKFKRLPDGATFNSAGFLGDYAQHMNTFGNQTHMTGLGLYLVENGTAQILSNINVPGDKFLDRSNVLAPGEANLNMAADGIGMLEVSDETREAGFGDSLMVIMGAQPLSDGTYLVTETCSLLNISGFNVIMVALGRNRAI